MSNNKKADENSIVVSDGLNNSVVPYVFDLERIEKPNCNLCQCPHRDFAEEVYDNQKRKNYTEIKRRLKNDHNFDATVPSIKNHMLYHYKVTQDHVSMQEHTDDIQKWMNMQTNNVASLKSRIALLERRMFIIDQESEDLDIVEKRKSAETVKKLAETILTCEGKLIEYKEEIKPVKLVFNQLNVIVKDELSHVDNAKTKKVVSTILDRLQESIGNMIVD